MIWDNASDDMLPSYGKFFFFLKEKLRNDFKYILMINMINIIIYYIIYFQAFNVGMCVEL